MVSSFLIDFVDILLSDIKMLFQKLRKPNDAKESWDKKNCHSENKDWQSIYLNPSLFKDVKFPMVSGISSSSLCCRSNVVRTVQFPMSAGRCSK